MLEMGQAFDLQRETCHMMSEALDCMLTATQAVCETVASLLSLVDDLVIKLLASFWGVAKEILSGGATVRKIISVLGDLRMLFKTLDAAFAFGAAATNASPGHKIDDVAGVGF